MFCRLLFRKLAVAAAFLFLISLARPSHAAVLDCAYTYTSKPGEPSMTFCVSPSGTLSSLTLPSGLQLITQAIIGEAGKLEGSEGYGLCTETPATAYWDYVNNVNETNNWGAATLVSHTATSVKFARKTSDGIWTLTQTFTADTKTPGVKLAMALRNNTNVDHVAYLVRYVIPAGNSSLYFFSSTQDRAFAWLSSSPDTFGYGLALQNQLPQQFGFMNGYTYSLDRVSGLGPNPCDFAAGAAFNGPLVFPGAGASLAMVYAGPVPAKKTKTANIFYNGMF